MGRISKARVVTLERQTVNLHQRLAALELQFAAPPAAQAAATVDRDAAAKRAIGELTTGEATPAAPPEATRSPVDLPRYPSSPADPSASPVSRASAPAREGLDLEDLLGGRVLAWTGGVAVVAGIAFLLATAVSRGWIGPSARTLLAGALSVALLGAGTWLYERRRRADAALAAFAAGIAGLFTTVAVGGPVYGVLPDAVALALALATGTLATAFAVRWESRGIGALGIVGGLLAPVIAGAPSTGTTLTVLWLAAASGAAVLVWQRWDWLALAVFLVPLGQWGWWLADAEPSGGSILLVLCLFGAVNVAAAIGYDLRVAATRVRFTSALLLSANATTLALAGWYALDDAGSTTLGRAWIGALAVAHIAVGLATRATRMDRDARLLSLVLGVVLADITAGLMLEGALLAGAFAVTTAGFGVLARRVLAGRDDDSDLTGRDAGLLGLGLGGHLLLTCAQALTQVPPDATTAGDAATFGGYAAIATTALAAFIAGRLVDEVRPQWRAALDCAALAGAAYLTAVALDGPALAAAYAAEAGTLGAIALRNRDDIAAWGGGAYLALALGYGLLIQVPLDALVNGVDDLAGAAVALSAAGAVALLGARQLGQALRRTDRESGVAKVLRGACATVGAAGAITLLYLASVAVVTALKPGDGAADAGLLDLGARELGQLLLSALWAVTGVVALVGGLRRDIRALRLGALALLLVTVGKVFLYDLAALTSLYRVGSLVCLGLLLLVAAGIWQRMRPRSLPGPAAPGAPSGERARAVPTNVR